MNIVYKEGNVAFNEMARNWYNDNKLYFDTRLYLSNKPHLYIDDKEKEIMDEGVSRYVFLKNKFDYISEFNLPINNTITYMSYMTYLYLTIPTDKIYNITQYITLAEYIIFDKKDSSMLIPLMYLISYSGFRISEKDCSILRKLIDDGMDKQSLNVYVNTLKLIKGLYFTIMPESVFKGYETFQSSYVWFMSEIHKLNKERSIANRKLSVSESDIIKDIVSIIRIRKIVL